MTLIPSEPVKGMAAGRLLQEARIQKGLSLEAMCKLLGMSQFQIQAIEAGDVNYFKKSTSTLIWHARIYAKKIGVHLPELVCNGIRFDSTSTSTSYAAPKIPAFLLKSPSQSETDATAYERR